MTLLAFVIAIVASFYAGYKYERLISLVKNLQETIKQKADAKKPVEEDKSVFVDPTDPVFMAKMEHERIMKTLNPDD